MKKQKLQVDYEYNFYLVGIIFPEKEYKLAWHLNRLLKINLAKNDDIIHNLMDFNLNISNFSYSTEHTIWRLLRNKCLPEVENTSNYLLPELKDFDFIFQIEGDTETMDTPLILKNIQSVPKCRYAIQLSIEKLKSKENLIF